MTASTSKGRRAGLLVEVLLLAAIAYSVIYSLHFLSVDGRLPQPYFHGANDTLMDWINVTYWSHNPGAYYAFLSVYPPISFDFLRLFSRASCYRFDNLYARDCDWLAPATLLTFYMLGAVAVYLVLRKHDRRTALVRAAAMTIGLPMLYALERGNLVVVGFLFFVLGQGRLLRSAWLRWICLAVSINFKPYLVAALLAQVVRRRWRWVEGAALIGMTVYLISYAMEGAGSPREILTNMAGFDQQSVSIILDWAYYASSYKEIVDALRSNFPFMVFVGSQPLSWMETFFPLMIHVGQMGVVLCFVGALLRPYCMPLHRLAALATAVVLTSTNAGGYSQIFLFFLVFLEPWRGIARITALVSVYLLSISVDYPLVPVAHAIDTSWLTNRVVGYDLFVQVGELTRPGLILLIEYALVIASLGDFVRAGRDEGRVERTPIPLSRPLAA